LSPADAGRRLGELLALPPASGGGVDAALAAFAALDAAAGEDGLRDRFLFARLVGEAAKHASVAWPFADGGGKPDAPSSSSSSPPPPARLPGPVAALRLYDRLLAAGGAPDVVVVNAALGAAGRAGDWGRAQALFDTAREKLQVRGEREKERIVGEKEKGGVLRR
jgi:hypothetical protein